MFGCFKTQKRKKRKLCVEKQKSFKNCFSLITSCKQKSKNSNLNKFFFFFAVPISDNKLSNTLCLFVNTLRELTCFSSVCVWKSELLHTHTHNLKVCMTVINQIVKHFFECKHCVPFLFYFLLSVLTILRSNILFERKQSRKSNLAHKTFENCARFFSI